MKRRSTKSEMSDEEEMTTLEDEKQTEHKEQFGSDEDVDSDTENNDSNMEFAAGVIATEMFSI